MTDEQYHLFTRWFKQYTRTFRETNPTHQQSLDLKEEHTFEVCSITDRITLALRLPENTRRIAAAIALFHDLGRFPQYQRYRTFHDLASENHAKLSLRELTKHQVLHALEPAERHLICRAIILHNRRRLPCHLDPETLLHCRLIRDADKVDILRVMAKEYTMPETHQNPVVTLGLSPKPNIRDEVYHSLFKGPTMSYNDLATTNELKLLQMSWVFDINFHPTFEILKEKNFLSIIAETLPDTPLRQKALKFVQAHIELRLKIPSTEF